MKLTSTSNLASLGPFYGAIAVHSVTRCRCGHRCDTWWMARAAAHGGKWAQHFSNASCSFLSITKLTESAGSLMTVSQCRWCLTGFFSYRYWCWRQPIVGRPCQ